VIQRIDRYVREHNVKSRSSFLADAAMEKLLVLSVIAPMGPVNNLWERTCRDAFDVLSGCQ
jgi:hypothetical protein